jgi:hypothetical protein
MLLSSLTAPLCFGVIFGGKICEMSSFSTSGGRGAFLGRPRPLLTTEGTFLFRLVAGIWSTFLSSSSSVSLFLKKIKKQTHFMILEYL